jgi:hypothetical protein
VHRNRLQSVIDPELRVKANCWVWAIRMTCRSKTACKEGSRWPASRTHYSGNSGGPRASRVAPFRMPRRTGRRVRACRNGQSAGAAMASQGRGGEEPARVLMLWLGYHRVVRPLLGTRCRSSPALEPSVVAGAVAADLHCHTARRSRNIKKCLLWRYRVEAGVLIVANPSHAAPPWPAPAGAQTRRRVYTSARVSWG